MPFQAAFVTHSPVGAKFVVCGSEDSHIYFWDLNQVGGAREATGTNLRTATCYSNRWQIWESVKYG